MHQLLCPYCFEKFRASEVAFRCLNPNPDRCPPEDDERLRDYMRLSVARKLPRVFTAQRNGWRRAVSATCSCGMKTTKMVCPHCHNTLPTSFGDNDSYTIAMIGTKESGKSHYIAVLINELKNRVGEKFNIALTADDQTIQRYNQDFRRYIYEKHEVIPATRSARAQMSVRLPLVYTFSLKRQKLFSNWLDGSLVFFDTAGEDLTDLDLIRTETKYLANSHGLIFLLDPLQIPAVRHRLGNSIPLPSENTDPEEIIGRVTQLIRLSNGLHQSAKIKTPVALAFSKIDAIRPLIEANSPVHQASHHDGFFNLAEAQEVSESMRAYVAEWVGTGLDRFLQRNFESSSYFGLSALGSPPDEHGRLPLGVAPFRVEDPLLWILNKLNIVPGRRS